MAEQGPASIDDLLSLYATETSNDQAGLIRAYGEIDDPRAVNKLLEIARSGETLELRASAIRRLGEHQNTVPQLISLYDSETNPELKAMVIRTLGEQSDVAAVRKLIAIAKSDASVELRKMAVRVLGQSNNPEALKFLEDLLK